MIPLEPPARLQAVYFDLDGTLVDNFEAIYMAYAHALAQLGLPTVDYDTVRRTVGGSIVITMQRLIGVERRDEAVRHFRTYFREHWHIGLRALPGAHQLLRECRRKGLKTAVFTNKDGDAARRITAHLGLDPLLDLTLGTNDTPWRKPQEPFSREALKRLGTESARSLLIGDSPFDIEAARVVGMRSYTVATGSHTLDQLEAENPDGTFADLTQLARHVFDFDLDPENNLVKS